MSGIVIGVGNEFRRDDGIGPAVVGQLQPAPGWRVAVSGGEPADLLRLWEGAHAVVMVDGVVCERPQVGAVHRWSAGDLAANAASVSSHGLGVVEACRMAQVLGRLPGRLTIIAIEIADTGWGAGFSDTVAAAVPALLAAVAAEMGALQDCECRICLAPK